MLMGSHILVIYPWVAHWPRSTAVEFHVGIKRSEGTSLSTTAAPVPPDTDYHPSRYSTAVNHQLYISGVGGQSHSINFSQSVVSSSCYCVLTLMLGSLTSTLVVWLTGLINFLLRSYKLQGYDVYLISAQARRRVKTRRDYSNSPSQLPVVLDQAVIDSHVFR